MRFPAEVPTRIENVLPGDQLVRPNGLWVCVESRPYSPNPDVMWLITWRDPTNSKFDQYFLRRDGLIRRRDGLISIIPQYVIEEMVLPVTEQP